ncbi:hypothetical protein TGRH88_085710 [Toxoplasma gondii]|uniref:Uncharacterized protein n=1 Tax=Toxoplasma gondii TaxID=5811 RepID=A0A7J6KGM6_TOXGO|nr:hypothetical protein TGRH88_085710 [Toxoplasma gondii]
MMIGRVQLLEVSKRHQASSVVRRDDHWIDVETAGTGGASQRVDSGDGGGDVIMRWGLPSNASRAQDRQDDSTPVELEIRFHSVTVAVDMELEVRDSEQACSDVRRSCHYMSRLGFGYTVQRGASQRVDSGDGGGDVTMCWGLPSNASRAQDRQDDSTPVELEIRFHSVTVAVDMELEVRDSEQACSDVRRSCHYMSRLGFGYTVQRGASQRVDSGDGGGDVIMRWGLPSNASRAQDRQDDSTPVELEIRFHSVTVAVDMELEVRDSEQACSVVRRSCHYMSRLGFGYTVQRGASQRVDSGDGGGDVTMCWGLPSNASRAQDRQDDSTPVELEIRFHSVTVAVDMELEVRDSEQACSVVRRSCHYMSRLGFGYTVQRGASQRVDSGDGGGDVIMRWGLPSNASRAQDRQDDSTPVELEIRFHSVTVAVDMELEVRDSEQACSDVRRSCHYMSRLGFGYTVQRGASQRVDSGDGGGDVIMRWGLPSNASRAQDRQDDSTPVELEIRFHSVTVAVDMELEVRDSEQACSDVRRSCHYMSRLGFGYTVQRGASQRVDSGDGGGDVIMRWGLPSNASRAQDRQDDSTPVELEIRFHSVTVAVDMELEVRDSEQACSVVRRSCHYMSRLGFGYTVQRGASQRVDSGDGRGDVIMRWGLPSNASRAQDRQDDSTPVELEIRFHSVTVAVDMFVGLSRRGFTCTENGGCWLCVVMQSVWEMVGRFVEARQASESVCDIVGCILQASESVWEMVGRIAQAREIREQKDAGTCESECPAWDAWANPVAEANDPSSLVSEYAACGVWRPHTVLPFSGMSLVAYLRGWSLEMVRPVYDMRFVECMRGWVRGYWLCVVMQSVWEMVGRIAQAREEAEMVRPVYDMRFVECMRGWVRGYWLCVVMQSVWEMVGRIAQAREIREQKDAGTCGVGGSAAGDSQRSDVALARIVDVLGVAAPHGRAVVWYRTRRVNAPMESECPAWDAWANPVAEANDPSSLVSEYAACGMWWPHTVLPFSRMSLVAYLRGWAWESVWEMVGRIAQARE